MTENEIAKRSLVKETFHIAWPAVIESIFVVIVGMIDTYMVSHLGKQVLTIVESRVPMEFVKRGIFYLLKMMRIKSEPSIF